MTSYDVLKNRLLNGKYFSTAAAKARITALADSLEITQEQTAELTALAEQHGDNGAPVEDRLNALETASLEHDVALMELAEMIGGGING